jgi:hypothetical protein
MSSFHTQGAVPLDAKPYVEREFERIVLQNVFNSRWVLVLGPRQHGKSTGLIRVNQKLAESGFLSAFVDLQGLAVNQIQSYQEFLGIFSRKVAQRLTLPVQDSPTGSDANQLIYWLEKIIPPAGQPIVIIIDEASSIPNDEWRNSFYGHIRSLKNEQAISKPDELVTRLRFVFSGCFRPDSLVETLNSPFNTCEEIPTDDLTFSQASELYTKVAGKANENLTQKVFQLVGGQPYLLQYIYSQIIAVPESKADNGFQKAIELLYSGQDNHIQYLFQRIAEDESLRELASDMVINSSIANDPADANSKFLRTLGLAKLDGKNLVFRNQLYKEFAENTSLLKQSVPNISSDPKVKADTINVDTLVIGDVKEMKKTKIDVSKSTISGSITVSDDIQNSFNTITSSETSDDIKAILIELGNVVDEMVKRLPKEEAEEMAEDYKRLADEAVKKSPRQKWYSVSIDGLQKAAKNLGDIGKPVIELTTQLIVLLSQLPK